MREQLRPDMASKPKPSPAEIAAKLVPLVPLAPKEKQIDAAVLTTAPSPVKEPETIPAPPKVSPQPSPVTPKPEVVATPVPGTTNRFDVTVAPKASESKTPEPKHSGFLAWLATKEGEEASDPRWFPDSPSRRQGEIERRLRTAWDAARA